MNHRLRKGATLKNLISMPFIYCMIIPLMFLDICLIIYQQICFRLYDLQFVKRKNYIRMDRHLLHYLRTSQRIGCLYCGYATGLIMWAQEIAGRTEQYWCGIKHNEDDDFVPPPNHKDFLKYGDEKAFRKRYSRD